MATYHPPVPAHWVGRKDTLARERVFQHIHCTNLQNTDLSTLPDAPVILGFCSDAGIVRNEGRPGAALGPDALRTAFGRLAWHAPQPILDAGNVVCEDGQLEAAQETFAALVADIHAAGRRTIGFGGGHEIAFAHVSGLCPKYTDLCIINLDAHLDLRPIDPAIGGTSGTPFRQIATLCETRGMGFHYTCIGMQPQANTASLVQTADALNTRIMTATAFSAKSPAERLAFLDAQIHHHTHIYLSICLDVFSESCAPGVSAPQPLGLFPADVIPLLKYLWQTGKVVAIDIAELSPPLDDHNRTARLAANMLAALLDPY